MIASARLSLVRPAAAASTPTFRLGAAGHVRARLWNPPALAWFSSFLPQPVWPNRAPKPTFQLYRCNQTHLGPIPDQRLEITP
jgi:hypothetical protein